MSACGTAPGAQEVDQLAGLRVQALALPNAWQLGQAVHGSGDMHLRHRPFWHV
jgi:hypothetical protein